MIYGVFVDLPASSSAGEAEVQVGDAEHGYDQPGTRVPSTISTAHPFLASIAVAGGLHGQAPAPAEISMQLPADRLRPLAPCRGVQPRPESGREVHPAGLVGPVGGGVAYDGQQIGAPGVVRSLAVAYRPHRPGERLRGGPRRCAGRGSRSGRTSGRRGRGGGRARRSPRRRRRRVSRPSAARRAVRPRRRPPGAGPRCPSACGRRFRGRSCACAPHPYDCRRAVSQTPCRPGAGPWRLGRPYDGSGRDRPAGGNEGDA